MSASKRSTSGAITASNADASNMCDECKVADLPSDLVKKDGGFFGRAEQLEVLKHWKQRVLISSLSEDGDRRNAASNGTTGVGLPLPVAYIDTITTTPLFPAILVWGVSGTGKSRLVEKFLNDQQQSPCYILRGKYDEYTGSSDPFSAIAQALHDFSSQLKDGPAEELDRIRKCTTEALGSGFGGSEAGDGESSSALSVMITVVPSLSILLSNHNDSGMERLHSSSGSEQNTTQPQDSSNMVVNESVWNRLQYIFLQFVKAISTKERPVYLFVDDLQWSSPIALELLANLISDSEMKHFLFLGSIRQELNPHSEEVLEVATDSPLRKSFLSRLQSQNRELTQITTLNLSLDATEHFLHSLLGDHPIDDLNALAQQIHIKTQGNIFFTIQTLEDLQRNNVLVYNDKSLHWEWDFDDANGEAIPISNDIMSAIESKLKQLPQDLQHVLSLAAYVRATFDVATLLHVVQNEQLSGLSLVFDSQATGITEEYLLTLLEKAVLEQLLSNPIGGTKYRFVHDRIQQAAYGMVPEGELRDMLRLRIGHSLLGLCRDPTERRLSSKHIPSNDDDRGLLFVAADHLNSAPTKDHMFSVMLNLEVGERAIQMAALASAAAYLKEAVKELEHVQKPWEEHYDISLRLYRARCDVELSLGHFQVGYDLGDQVLAKAKTLDDKLPTHLSLANALGREEKHLESFHVCLRAATNIGEFPRRWYFGHIARDMMKISAFFRENDDDAILQIPLMTNRRRLTTMKLLSEISLRAHLTQNLTVWLVTLCKHIRNTIRFGLCEDSAIALANFGMLASTRGDPGMAMRCAGLAVRVESRYKGKNSGCMASLVTCAFIIPFRSPIADVIQGHRNGYARSMKAGEFETAFFHSQMSIVMAYIVGYELKPLVQATEITLEQSKMYGIKSLNSMAVEYLAMMQMMIGVKPVNWHEIERSANRDIKREMVD